MRYIEGDITAAEMPFWLECFESAPEPLSEAEKTHFLQTLRGVSISSDAFFPFRYSIYHMCCILCRMKHTTCVPRNLLGMTIY